MKLDKTGNEDIGKQFAKIEQSINDGAGGGIDLTGLTIATADGSDLATTQALANVLKARFNTLVARLQAAQDAAD